MLKGKEREVMMERASELDLRRQAQIVRQSKRITVHVEFLEERDLLQEFNVWEQARNDAT